jgi:hypothetical protein
LAGWRAPRSPAIHCGGQRTRMHTQLPGAKYLRNRKAPHALVHISRSAGLLVHGGYISVSFLPIYLVTEPLRVRLPRDSHVQSRLVLCTQSALCGGDSLEDVVACLRHARDSHIPTPASSSATTTPAHNAHPRLLRRRHRFQAGVLLDRLRSRNLMHFHCLHFIHPASGRFPCTVVAGVMRF